MSVEISFDKEMTVANIQLAEWAPPLVEHLGRYFDLQQGLLRLDYVHLSAESKDSFLWCDNERENFEFSHKPIRLPYRFLDRKC